MELGTLEPQLLQLIVVQPDSPGGVLACLRAPSGSHLQPTRGCPLPRLDYP